MIGPYVRLLDGVESYDTGEGLLLAHGVRAMRIRGGGAGPHTLVEQLRAGAMTRDLVERYGLSAERMLSELAVEGWLTTEPPMAPDARAHWQRQVGYLGAFGPDPQAQQRRICSAKVGIVGVGGIGGLAAQHLAGAGVGAFWLLDHDEVAVHNLNRQYMFGHDDVGTVKVSAAAGAVRRIFPDASVEPIRRRVKDSSDLEVLPDLLDLIIVAADEPADLMDSVWSWAEVRRVPVVRAAVGLESGWWGPVVSVDHASCWWHFEDDRLRRLSPSERRLDSAASVPMPWSFGPTNAAVAAMLAHDALQFLASGECVALGHRAVLDFSRMTVNVIGDAACDAAPGVRCALRKGDSDQ